MTLILAIIPSISAHGVWGMEMHTPYSHRSTDNWRDAGDHGRGDSRVRRLTATVICWRCNNHRWHCTRVMLKMGPSCNGSVGSCYCPVHNVCTYGNCVFQVIPM